VVSVRTSEKADSPIEFAHRTRRQKTLFDARLVHVRDRGAESAGELDAKRAIDQGTRLAAQIERAESGQVFEAPLTFGAHVYKAVAKRMGAE